MRSTATGTFVDGTLAHLGCNGLKRDERIIVLAYRTDAHLGGDGRHRHIAVATEAVLRSNLGLEGSSF